MITNAQVITDALRLVNVISEIETPSAEQGSHGLRLLNQLIESWTEDGIELGYFAQDDTTDDCPIPAKSELAVITILATRLAAVYGAVVSPELAVTALEAYNTLLRNTIRDQMQEGDMGHMPQGEAFWGTGISILTDE